MAPSTKEKILDAAERQFAELGYDGTSLRAITAAAQANIAAVNYHFKSKEELLRAVLVRRLRPVNERRLVLLDEYEKALGKTPPKLERLIEIMLGPILELCEEEPERAGFQILFGRMYSEPARNIHHIFYQEMRVVVERFVIAFRRAMPSVPPVELFWKMNFAIGATAHTLAGFSMIQTLSGGLCNLTDVPAVKKRLVAFALAGMQANPPSSAGSVEDGMRNGEKRNKNRSR